MFPLTNNWPDPEKLVPEQQPVFARPGEKPITSEPGGKVIENKLNKSDSFFFVLTM